MYVAWLANTGPTITAMDFCYFSFFFFFFFEKYNMKSISGNETWV